MKMPHKQIQLIIKLVGFSIFILSVGSKIKKIMVNGGTDKVTPIDGQSQSQSQSQSVDKDIMGFDTEEIIEG